MLSLIKFLGSIYFTIPLLLLSGIGVAIATLIESRTGSHEIASNYVYSNPLFYFLLACYFINILVSALLRYPFKKKHFPFLLTHLGLLMIITGVFCKQVWGLQGVMLLKEGAEKNSVSLPGTYAISLQNEGEHIFIPIDLDHPGGFHDVPAHLGTLRLNRFIPHANLRHQSFATPHSVMITGLPPLPYGGLEKPIVKTRLEKESSVSWSIYTLQSNDLDKDLELFSPTDSSLVIAYNPEDFTTAFALYQDGKKAGSALFNPKAFSSYIMYEGGYGGYGAHVKLDYEAPDRKGDKRYIALEEALKEALKSDNLIKPLRFVKELAAKSNLDATELLMAYLWEMHQKLLESDPYLSYKEKKILYRALENHGITYQSLAKDIPNDSSLYLESPLKPVFFWDGQSEANEKTPAVTLEYGYSSPSDTITLLYDSTHQGMKWPLQNGKWLASFVPMQTSLPFKVRLKQARTIKHPGSTQTKSYESDLLITDLSTDQEKRVTLSMNQPYETENGTRLYLSHIAGDEGELKTIQIVINRDPVKYYLTYPGGILVAIGAFLLFFRPKLFRAP